MAGKSADGVEVLADAVEALAGEAGGAAEGVALEDGVLSDRVGLRRQKLKTGGDVGEQRVGEVREQPLDPALKRAGGLPGEAGDLGGAQTVAVDLLEQQAVGRGEVDGTFEHTVGGVAATGEMMTGANDGIGGGGRGGGDHARLVPLFNDW